MSTSLFNIVSRHGHSVTKKRAFKKNPHLAERESDRDKGHYIAVSEGPGGLDGYFADITLRHTYRPLWFRCVMQIHWWFEKHGIRPTCRNIKYFWQRGRRGYSDRDLWGFDTFLATVIRDGVAELNAMKNGWPGDPMTFEEWGVILEEISDGMQAALTLGDLTAFDWRDDDAVAALHARHDLAMDHLKQVWFALWD